jgi:retron-type reverse transcriptase
VIDCIAEPLSAIFNLCLIDGVYPDKLKIAKVCPIFKDGNKNEFTNYRPISIIPSFSKIFEKIISCRLLSYINKYNIFNPAQYGFRKKHSTYMAMLNLYDKVSAAVDNNEYSIGIFIDLSKAFDTVNHDILLKKLELYGIRGIPNLLLKSYLQNRQQYVFYNSYASTLKPIVCGVPQGSI